VVVGDDPAVSPTIILVVRQVTALVGSAIDWAGLELAVKVGNDSVFGGQLGGEVLGGGNEGGYSTVIGGGGGGGSKVGEGVGGFVGPSMGGVDIVGRML
jgi:hypothetical protein